LRGSLLFYWGAWAGAVIASVTGGDVLRVIFGVFLLILGGARVYFTLKKRREEGGLNTENMEK
jgi:uncharacterized membrane protein YfcA